MISSITGAFYLIVLLIGNPEAPYHDFKYNNQSVHEQGDIFGISFDMPSYDACKKEANMINSMSNEMLQVGRQYVAWCEKADR